MDIAYKKAYTDVLYLINTFDKKLRCKISDSFIEFMEENKELDYTPNNISLSRPDSLSQETKNVLSLLYRTYFDEKVNTKDESKEKLNIPDNKSIVVQTKQDSVFRKIFNFIKHIFTKRG